MGMFDDIPAAQPAAKAGAPYIDIELPGGDVHRDPARPGQPTKPSAGLFDDIPPATPTWGEQMGKIAQSQRDVEAAALQGVNPNATSKYFPEKPENKPKFLGHVDNSGEIPVYKMDDDANAEPLRVNPKTDFMARNPETGRLAVYARNAQTDEGKLNSLSRLVAPGLATGPVSSSIRRIPEAAAPAAGVMPLSSAAPPAGVTVAQRAPGQVGTAVGAQLATQRAQDAVRDAQSFDKLDVRKPAIAFMQGPAASVGKQLSETWGVGAPLKNALDDSLFGAARAAERVAGQYGSASTPETAGAAIRQGIERFKDARPNDVVERAAAGYTPAQRSDIIKAPARESSLKTKQAALYERAWSRIPEEMQQGRAVEGLPRVMGQMPESKRLLSEIQSRNLRMMNSQAPGAEQAAKPIASSGMVGRMIDAIMDKNWTGSLQTMRDIRSEFRRMASGMGDTEKNTMRISDMERFQSAVTRDMVALLERNAARYEDVGNRALPFPRGRSSEASQIKRAILEFKRSDTFTRASMQRMETIEKLFNAPSAEALYRNVATAALSKGRGDLEKLRVLSKTLRGPEMDDLAAAVIRQLGEPGGSARGAIQEAGFSPSSFLTRWQNMTPEARALIFGHEHTEALSDLVRVASRLANVEALANTSRTGTNVLNIGALGAAATMIATGKIIPAAALAGTGFGASLLLSRPSYVRWVTKYAELRAAALRGSVNSTAPAMAAHINRLGQLAQHDQALLPVFRGVAAENGVVEGRDEKQKKK